MKESLKEVILMGLGAISLTGEKAMELKKELLEKGESIYKDESIKNEELKRDIKEKIKDEIKENTNIKYTKIDRDNISKDDIIEVINTLTDEEKNEILDFLKNEKKDEK